MSDEPEQPTADVKMVGYYMDNDRRWIMHTPEFSAEIAEYNDELTGFDRRLHELFPEVFHYGGNAYYITGRFAAEKGWRVEPVPYRNAAAGKTGDPS